MGCSDASMELVPRMANGSRTIRTKTKDFFFFNKSVRVPMFFNYGEFVCYRTHAISHKRAKVSKKFGKNTTFVKF